MVLNMIIGRIGDIFGRTKVIEIVDGVEKEIPTFYPYQMGWIILFASLFVIPHLFSISKIEDRPTAVVTDPSGGLKFKEFLRMLL